MEELNKWLEGLGFRVPNLKLDGEIIRFGDKLASWFVGHEFPSKKHIGHMVIVATVGDWKTGQLYRFKPEGLANRAEEKRIKELIESQRARIERERETAWAQASHDASKFFESFRKDVHETEYTKRKKVSVHETCRVGSDDKGEFLAVPLRDVEGRLWTFQKIYGDGAKRFFTGGKKKGNFYRFGGIEEHVYIAEGFATAYSIWKASNSTVIAAIDAGNIPAVATALRAKYPNLAFTYCADRDESGVGEKYAREACALTLGEVILPPEGFKDFNDAWIERGDDILPKTRATPPVIIPLGFLGDSHFYTSSHLQAIHEIAAFTVTDLLKLMPLEFWETRFPGKKTIAWDAARDWLVKLSAGKGKFDEAVLRGLGTWEHEGKIVTHLGDRLDVDGETRSLRELNHEYVYVRDSHQPDLLEPMGTEDSKLLWEIIDSLATEHDDQKIYLAGWIAIARLSGLLPWRPHIWVTGESGAGKTTVLQEIVKPLLGRMVRMFSGGTTEAGMRQAIQNMAVPVIYDEFETNDIESMKLVKRCLSFIRQASSDTEAFVYKGSASGAASRYRARFCAMVGSVRPNLELQEDRSRFTVIELKRREDSERSRDFARLVSNMEKLTPEYCERFYARLVRNWKAVRRTIQLFQLAIAESQSARFAQQYAPLLGGYWMIEHDAPPTVEEIAEVIARCNFDREPQNTHEAEQTSLLDYILSSQVQVNSQKGSETFTIGEACEKIIEGDQTREWRRALNNTGLSVVKREGELYEWNLHVRANNPGLARILRDEPRFSSWSHLLGRINGAQRNVTAKYKGDVGWQPAKGTLVPLKAGVTE